MRIPAEALGSNLKKEGVNPWLLVLVTVPIPLILLGVMGYRWYERSTDAGQIASDLIRRQNTIIAYDAMGVGKDFAALLESAFSDTRTLALVPPSESNYRKFIEAHAHRVTVFQRERGAIQQKVMPLYREIAYYSLSAGPSYLMLGDRFSKFSSGLGACLSKDLCDRELLEELDKLPEGQLRLGRVYRWYSNKDEPEDVQGALLRVGMRLKNAILTLGISYRQIQQLLYTPTFPYGEKTDLLLAYAQGNYIYVVDGIHYDLLVHPKYWHVTGIDKQSGKRVTPAVTDADLGSRPLNVLAYRGHSLRDYFDRLLTTSFLQRSVDMFRAPNLEGTYRVLAVAPILFSQGQYEESGIFGFVIVGVGVDHFEEPQEKVVPYY